MNQEQPPLNIDEVDSPSKPNRHPFPVGKITAIGAGALLLLGIGKGINNGESKAPDHPGQTASESYTPPISPSSTSVETQTPPTSNEKLIDFNSFEISADKYKTPEAITKQFVENYNNLLNAGFNKAYDSLLNPGDTDMRIDGFESTLDVKIIPKMFTDSDSGRELSTNFENHLRRAVIELYSISERDPSFAINNKARYATGRELVDFKLISADSTTIVVHTEEHQTDNGNMNVGDYQISHGQPGQMDITVYQEITFKLDPADKTWKADRITYYKDMVDHNK